MASTKNYTGPNPNPNLIPNHNPNAETEVAEAAPLAQKQFTGARYKKGGGYVAEIRHGNQRFWLGTFGTAYEAGLAYDMAAMRLRHRTYNFPVDASGRIITEIDPAKQDYIEKQVVRKLGDNTGLGAQNTDQKAETSTKRKMAPKSGKASKKREVDEEQRAKELEGFL